MFLWHNLQTINKHEMISKNISESIVFLSKVNIANYFNGLVLI